MSGAEERAKPVTFGSAAKVAGVVALVACGVTVAGIGLALDRVAKELNRRLAHVEVLNWKALEDSARTRMHVGALVEQGLAFAASPNLSAEATEILTQKRDEARKMVDHAKADVHHALLCAETVARRAQEFSLLDWLVGPPMQERAP